MASGSGTLYMAMISKRMLRNEKLMVTAGFCRPPIEDWMQHMIVRDCCL